MTDERLWHEAEARWRTIVAERPDLESAIALQRSLIRRVIETSRAVATGGRPELEFPPRYLALKIDRGVPLFHGERLPIPNGRLGPFLTDFANDLAAAGAGSAAEHVAAALQSGRIDPGSLLAASLARNQDAVRVSSAHLSLAPDLVWLVGELATGGFVHQMAHSCWSAIAGRSPSDDEQALDHDVEAELARTGWNRGYCPTCGSWPVLAVFEGRARVLHCSYCATPWRTREHACTYCGASNEQFRIFAPDEERQDRWIETCGVCGGYLKAIARGSSPPFPLLAIEDLATVDLDRQAMNLGYGRPPLPSSYPA